MLRKLVVLLVLLTPAGAFAESGASMWLRYAPLEPAVLRANDGAVPGVVVALGDGAPIQSARQELVTGIRGMLAKELRAEAKVPAESAIVIGTLAALRQAAPALAPAGALGVDGYALRTVRVGAARHLVIAGESERGVLYGVFALLRRVALGQPVGQMDLRQAPYAPVRWVDEWDNVNGTIERGYGGRSIFWDSDAVSDVRSVCPPNAAAGQCGHVRQDLDRVREYARMLASLGINGVSLNNVNANVVFLSPDMLPQVARIADVFRPWGIRVALAIDFGSPQSLGKLNTYDPLDPTVIAWWKTTTDTIYRVIPDFAGFVLKADSEGRVGPSTYNRTHADAANVVARALEPHGGLIFYRGFVYDHHMDWQDPKNDRGRAAYDNFKPLDGLFDDNVIIQIKNGPIDFQVREPASPLFGALEKTNEAVELQITQEYMGQARHTVFLAPMWKATLDFDVHARDTGTPVKAIVAGKVFGRPTGGFVGVSNVGLDDSWYGNQLSQANLYAFGRLAWDPDLTAAQIIDEWTRLTFGHDQKVVDTVAGIQLSSWRTYENYTGPLGLQTLTDIVGNHYGVAVEASERNGWGQWHFADDKGVGMDRTVATGTGYVGQYRPEVAKQFETLAAQPDDLVLFMHHVPYTYVLHDGKSVIQYIYDSHYDGAAAVAQYVRDWKTLKGRIDDQRYSDVLAQLEYQAGQAVVWRDAVNGWFFRASKIPDAKGRVDHFPGRMEAETSTLAGYVTKSVTPLEGASGGKYVECPAGTTSCSATFTYDGLPGRRDLIVQYYDINNGTTNVARYRVSVSGRVVGEWAATDHVPTVRVDSSSSARKIIAGVTLATGDQIEIEGMPAAPETAALDYVEVADAQP